VERRAKSDPPTVHRFPAKHEGAFVNAYLVETASGAVAVDALLTVSESRAMRHALEGMGKPLRAVLLTHSHPDTRNAADCAAIDPWRAAAQSAIENDTTVPAAPAPQQDCPATFGNSDTFRGSYPDPTP
jgi:glyoxylase-like metal-dependent hydrolase (beta-lactamase superfamily II)